MLNSEQLRTKDDNNIPLFTKFSRNYSVPSTGPTTSHKLKKYGLAAVETSSECKKTESSPTQSKGSLTPSK